MTQPDPNPAADVVDLRAGTGEAPVSGLDVRSVLESAADVIFSDGVSAEFLDQWTFETMQLLEARARERELARARTPSRPPVSAGRR